MLLGKLRHLIDDRFELVTIERDALEFSCGMISTEAHFEANILARLANQMAVVNGLADTLEAERDQDADGDDSNVYGEVFEAVNGALRSVEFHARSV